jgi:signal transduction histidine kinase
VIRPRRALLAVLLATSGLVTVAAAWFGWRLVAQQRELEARRSREQAETTADAMTASLRGRLAELGEQLSGWLSDPNTVPPAVDGGVLLLARAGRFTLQPRRGLPYLPGSPAATPSPSVFAAVETIEFADPMEAARRYRQLADDRSSEVRAGALLRLGRTLRKSGDFGGAAAAYERLRTFDGFRADGFPADLVALDGLRLVAGDRGDTAGGARIAEEIMLALDAGTWAITRGIAELYRAELSGEPRPVQWLLAEALADLWSDPGAVGALRGLRVARGDGRGVITMWRRQGAVVAAVAIPADVFVRPSVPSGSAWQLRDGDDRTIAGQRADVDVFATRVVGNGDGSWTLLVWSDSAVAALGEGRGVLVAMMAGMLLCLWGATYFIVRSLRREAEVGRLQSDFVAAVSHEFRSPLTTVRQMAEMLEANRVPSDQRRHEYYRVIGAEAARLQRLVETVLNFGRLEAGVERYRHDALDAGTLVQSAVAAVEPQARQAGMAIETAGPNQPIQLRGDEDALRLALRNLLENAIKYSPEQPTVWVRWHVVTDRVAIQIVDRGLGVAADERQAIFRKFVRGRAAADANVRGTGVGLAIVHQIVLAHGGDIQLESEPGQGSTFTLRLPMAS